MSGGHFNYHQHFVNDVADEIEKIVKKEESPRPEITKELCVSIWERVSDTTRYSVNYLKFNTYEEAMDFFKSRNYEINETNTETGKREFTAVSSKKTYEVHEFVYQRYLDENGEEIHYYDYSKETLDEFRKAIKILRTAAIYAQRIDWLVSDDDGEESFHRRLKEELDKLEENENKG